MLPVALAFSDGKANDKTRMMELVEKAKPSAGAKLLADRGYAYNSLHDALEALGFNTCIPPRSNLKMQWFWDKDTYKRRNVVERFFCKLKQYRSIATRYAKRIRHFKAIVFLASILIILKHKM